MATPLYMKRMLREREALEKPNDDFLVCFEDDNLLSFYAYVFGPADSLYAYKFVKLRIEIPEQYPLIPPKCTFIQHSGGRIHPNLYVEGKICLSILGTWPGEPWALAMSVQTILITVRSLLDNEPYKHEPGQKDHKEFNRYVQYTTWRSLLLDYLHNETNVIAKARLQQFISRNGTDMITELRTQAKANSTTKQLSSPYGGCSSRTQPMVDYEALLADVTKLVEECRVAQMAYQAKIASITCEPIEMMEVGSKSEADGNTPRKDQKRVKLSATVSHGTAIVDLTKLHPDSGKEDGSLGSNPMNSFPVATINHCAQPASRAKPSLKRKLEMIDLT